MISMRLNSQWTVERRTPSHWPITLFRQNLKERISSCVRSSSFNANYAAWRIKLPIHSEPSFALVSEFRYNCALERSNSRFHNKCVRNALLDFTSSSLGRIFVKEKPCITVTHAPQCNMLTIYILISYPLHLHRHRSVLAFLVSLPQACLYQRAIHMSHL